MPSPTVPEEVRILRFFESSPMEKAEAVFNIVCEKMRQRRGSGANAGPPASVPKKRSVRLEKDNPATENAV